LSDQVEVKVARANRAFTRSRRIVASATDDLQDHQRWLDQHRLAWTEDLKRGHRLLKRKQLIWSCKRLAVGLLLLPSFAFISLLRRAVWIVPVLTDWLAIRLSRVNEAIQRLARLMKKRQSRLLLRFTRHPQFQTRIRGLDGTLWNAKAAHARLRLPARMVGEIREVPDETSAVTFARLARPLEGRSLACAGGLVIVGLIAAASVCVTLTGLSDENPVQGSSSTSTPPAAAMPTVPIAQLSRRSISNTSVAGFRVLDSGLVPDPQPLSAPTIASMMLVRSPAAVTPTEQEALDTPIVGESLGVKPQIKPKLKRKLAKRETQSRQLPWWHQLPWIRVR
jgi:hypothetical protein